MDPEGEPGRNNSDATKHSLQPSTGEAEKEHRARSRIALNTGRAERIGVGVVGGIAARRTVAVPVRGAQLITRFAEHFGQSHSMRAFTSATSAGVAQS